MKRRSVLILLFVVLVLAVALPAAAQPAPKNLAPLDERGESGSPAPNLSEVEPNNNFQTADMVYNNTAVAGAIGAPGDVDYYYLDGMWNRSILIDIDAHLLGSVLDPVVCLHALSEEGNYATAFEVKCSDDADYTDSLLFYRPYYIDGLFEDFYVSVKEWNHPNEGGDEYDYTLSFYRPELFSTATNGTVAGVAFKNQDVLAHHDFYDGTEKWMLFFDASDVGITSNLNSLTTLYDSLVFSVAKAESQWIDGATQTIKPWDTVQFNPGQYGPSTWGDFYFMFHGSDYGLTKSSEKIDALADYRAYSTTGAATGLLGEKAADEDLFDPIFMDTLWLDGSTVPGLAAEDVFAADGDWPMYLTILGSGKVGGVNVNQKMVFEVTSQNVVSVYFNAPAHHLNANLDAIEIVDEY